MSDHPGETQHPDLSDRAGREAHLKWCDDPQCNDRAHVGGTFDDLNPPYGTIVADPPWHYEGRLSIPGGNRARGPINVQAMTFSTMTVDDIAVLPVRSLAADDASLFLWATSAYLPGALTVMAAWGFTYSQTLVWKKTGNPSPFGGRVAPNHAEFLLVGTRGKPARKGRVASSVCEAPKERQHSRKPALFGDLIEAVAHGPYVELFARSPRLGWDSWGHGYELTGALSGGAVGDA